MKPRLQARHLTAVLGALLFGAALWILHRELRSYHYADLVRELRALPTPQILLALCLTALDYAVLTSYDALGLRYVGHPLETRRVALASFVGYAASNSLGFPLLTGAPLRYRLYSRWGVPPIEITRVVAFYTATFFLGLLAVGGVAFLVDPLPIPAFLHAPIPTLRPVGALLLLALGSYLGLSVARRGELRIGRVTLAVPPPRFAFSQVALSALDWLLASAILFVLLPPGTISYPALVAIFILGQLAGLLSHVPGAVGVFESVVVIFLTPALPAPRLLGILLVFRGLYYLLPLAVAGLALGAYESRHLRRRLPLAQPLAEWFSALVPQAMAGLVFGGGVILLFSGATPGVGSRLAFLDRTLPLPIVEASHLLASAIGVALLLLARGLQLRLNAAHHLTAALLAGGIALSLLKGLDYEEASALTLVLAALWMSRRQFYRPAALFEERFTAGWIAAVAVVLGATLWLGFFSFRHVAYSQDLWWQFDLKADAPRFLRAAVASAVVVGAVGIARLLRPAQPAPQLPGPVELERAEAVIARQERTGGNLALLGDKALLFSESGNAFLMYAVEGRSWVAMGDPVGPPGEARELAWRFRELCEQRAAFPVFYEVSTEALPIYLDMGLTLSKLGEEARVPLHDFSLEGRSRKQLRQTQRRVERDGGSFEVVPRECVPALLPELRAVSDEWLAKKKVAEKGFSLGRFSEDYLLRFPMAVVRAEGRVVAFANVWAGGPGTEISVDLMRYRDDVLTGVMDYLFLELMLWGHERGYRWFNLGMAPFSGLEARRHAPLWSRLGGLLFRHGENFYNFQGLRRYKEKFEPVWEPRYLASPGGLTLPRVLANVGTLISGGVKGVVGR
jgi:phosphatidylglycerol lysyltransferase